jgi:hypothetical protein
VVLRATLTAVALAVANCGEHADALPAQAVRTTAQAYLDALAGGDGAKACRLLSPTAMRDGGYRTFAGCVRRHSRMRALGPFRVVRVKMTSANQGWAYIDDAAISDSGDDALPVTRYERRWLLDAD